MSYKSKKYILSVSCDAASGLVATITDCISRHGCYICSLDQFDDEDNNKFFMRLVFRFGEDGGVLEKLSRDLSDLEAGLGLSWKIKDAEAPTRTLIMVSKYDHCLKDLLYRNQKGELNLEISAVVSNHQDLRAVVEREGIRFVHLPVTQENKSDQEGRLLEIFDETQSEMVILARYMQILSDDLSKKLLGRCINIHHSFLPGFKGAKPYHQAFERGVKVIGATAHYVTSDLDEGPIIEQILSRVNHAYDPEALTQIGRDNECMALAKAVRYHSESRVFIDGNKTIVFDIN